MTQGEKVMTSTQETLYDNDKEEQGQMVAKELEVFQEERGEILQMW